jgi:hypothetical protein
VVRQPEVRLMLTADEIFSRPPMPMAWPSSGPMLALAIELLPKIADDRIADLVELLALALVDRGAELHAVRSVGSLSLALSHAQHKEIVRLRNRLAALLEAGRSARTVAA